MRIVGIVLLRNEDMHARRAIENISGFCDRILVADHCSTDATPRIIRELAANYSHIESHRIDDPRASHILIKPFAGTDTWIFGVDGDEIYDATRLAQLRPRLLQGEFGQWWMILGNVLNCDFLDPLKKMAAGFLAPPCRSITKLYNFQAIRSWGGDTPERLHGGCPDFLPGHDASQRLNLHEQMPWDESTLRCLHACFLPRSSLDSNHPRLRENIMDVHAAGAKKRVRRFLKKLLGQPIDSDWKRSRYARGERVTVDVTTFFS